MARTTSRPGPQVPFYLLGRKVCEVYPFVPFSPQAHARSIGVLSFDGGVYFELAGDRNLLGDIEDAASDVEAALAEQVTTA